MATALEPAKVEISVYLDDGRVFVYEVEDKGNGAKQREHVSEIIKGGYRHCEQDGTFEVYPPHRILKVKTTGVNSLYPDRIRGT